jgi:hypothetical protein
MKKLLMLWMHFFVNWVKLALRVTYRLHVPKWRHNNFGAQFCVSISYIHFQMCWDRCPHFIYLLTLPQSIIRYRIPIKPRAPIVFPLISIPNWSDEGRGRYTYTFSHPEPFLRAVNGARRWPLAKVALAKSISNWHLIGYNEGHCSNAGYILLPYF